MDRKILVIEDDPDMAEALRMPLEANGYEVIHAPTGEEGLQKVKEVEPDLIILDISSPDSHRWETLLEIRKLPYIPVIALTTPDDLDSIVESLIYGADYSMTKPVRVRELRARIRALLRRSRRTAAARVAA